MLYLKLITLLSPLVLALGELPGPCWCDDEETIQGELVDLESDTLDDDPTDGCNCQVETQQITSETSEEEDIDANEEDLEDGDDLEAPDGDLEAPDGDLDTTDVSDTTANDADISTAADTSTAAPEEVDDSTGDDGDTEVEDASVTASENDETDNGSVTDVEETNEDETDEDDVNVTDVEEINDDETDEDDEETNDDALPAVEDDTNTETTDDDEEDDTNTVTTDDEDVSATVSVCTLPWDGTQVDEGWQGENEEICYTCYCDTGDCDIMVCAQCTLSDGTSVDDGWTGMDGCNDCSCSDGALGCEDLCTCSCPGGLTGTVVSEEEDTADGEPDGCLCPEVTESCVCTTDYTPVCSTSGKQHPNMCELECEGEVLDCAGDCPCIVSPPHDIYPSQCDCDDEIQGEMNAEGVCICPASAEEEEEQGDAVEDEEVEEEQVDAEEVDNQDDEAENAAAAPSPGCDCPTGSLGTQADVADDTWDGETDGCLCSTPCSCPDGTTGKTDNPVYDIHDGTPDGCDCAVGCPLEEPKGLSCVGRITCSYGNECCCGECFHSIRYDCYDGGQWGSFHTEACMNPSCEDDEAEAIAEEPLLGGPCDCPNGDKGNSGNPVLDTEDGVPDGCFCTPTAPEEENTEDSTPHSEIASGNCNCPDGTIGTFGAWEEDKNDCRQDGCLCSPCEDDAMTSAVKASGNSRSWSLPLSQLVPILLAVAFLLVVGYWYYKRSKVPKYQQVAEETEMTTEGDYIPPNGYNVVEHDFTNLR